MRKNIKISIILFFILFLLTSGSVQAKDRFEKGSGLYTHGKFPAITFFCGHAGLYWKWEGEDPEDDTSHITIESLGSIFFWLWPDQGPTVTNFKEFMKGKGAYVGAFTIPNIDRRKRKIIVETAKAQVDDGAHYGFVRGYKNPESSPERPKSFRCDGLVEYCYEVALGEPWQPGNNGGIVENDTWRTLTPFIQMGKMVAETPRLEKLTFHEQGIINVGEAITPSKYLENKYNIEEGAEITIKFYASDGDKGSGLTRAELWLKKPDGTIIEEIDVKEAETNYDKEHTYTASFDTSGLEEGKKYILCAQVYDQAGNSKVEELPFGIGIPDKWEGYDLRLTFERDTDGPVYAIYYKETSEDDWIELGEYDTQDTGGSSDIILNLDLDLEEFESEDDDADRITHQYKLVMVTTGKDVFKEAYGYKTIRLIVDTTEDWNAGEKDGITVEEGVCDEEGEHGKSGCIKPGFGEWEGISCWPVRMCYKLYQGDYEDCEDAYSRALGEAETCEQGFPDHPSFDNFWIGHIYLPFGGYRLDYFRQGTLFLGGEPRRLKISVYGEALWDPESGCGSPILTVTDLGELTFGHYPNGTAYSKDVGLQSGDYVVTSSFDISGPYSCSCSHCFPEGHYGVFHTYISFQVLNGSQGIWKKTFSNITSEKYHDPELVKDYGKGVSATGGWTEDGAWEIEIEFPYEEIEEGKEVSTCYDEIRYDFKERKTEENPA